MNVTGVIERKGRRDKHSEYGGKFLTRAECWMISATSAFSTPLL